MPGEPGLCGVCGRELASRQTGRPARFCSRACRQKAYRDRASGRDSGAAVAAITGPDGLLAREDSAPNAAEKAVPHLSESELLAWRGLLEVHARLLPTLDDELSSVTGLSLSEFDVLYQLWIRPGGRMRMKRLAAALLITPGGATRIVKRLENDKLVRRLSRAGEQAVEAELTAPGRERLAVAMDIHFAGVRQLLQRPLRRGDGDARGDLAPARSRAFVTNNMEETVKFYNGLLGFPVVVTLQLPNPDPFPGAVPGNLGGSRHYFFRISEQDTVAFFEFADVEVPADNSLLGAGNHLAITVPSEGELQKAKKLLEENDIKIKSDLDHGFCHSIYFEDPVNKIALEFATWQHPCDTAQPFLQDPNPVPAALAAIGADTYAEHQLHFEPDGHGGAGERD